MRRCQVLLTIGLLAACALSPMALAQNAGTAPARGGTQIFGRWCSDCHSTPTGPGSTALQRRYQGAVPAVLEQRSGLTGQYVTQVVRRGIGIMPSFRKTEISDAELALVAQYLASAPRSGAGVASQ